MLVSYICLLMNRNYGKDILYCSVLGDINCIVKRLLKIQNYIYKEVRHTISRSRECTL